jgi:hypothetical protein
MTARSHIVEITLENQEFDDVFGNIAEGGADPGHTPWLDSDAPPNQIPTIVVDAGVPAGVTNNQPANRRDEQSTGEPVRASGDDREPRRADAHLR